MSAAPGSNLALLSSLSLAPTSLASQPVSPPPPSRPVVPMPGTALPPPVTPKPEPAPTVLPALSEEERIGRLTLETEKLQGLLANMSSRTLGGLSPLEQRWKEVHEQVEVAGVRRSVSVARCYPALNRVPDVLPFDQTRVELKSCKDDYINASRIDSLEGCGPGAVICQAPLAKQLGEFWSLVWQELTEVMVCLVPDHDLGDAVYLPEVKQKQDVGGFTVATFSCRQHPSYTERVVNLTNCATKTTRALVHLQMRGWPGPDLPSSPSCLLDTATAVLGLRSRSRVLVHCVEGGSKSGTFLAVLWLVAGMESAGGAKVPSSPTPWPPVIALLAHIMLQRKGVVRDKQYLKLVYDSLLYYCQDVLMKQGILNTGPKSGAGSVRSHSRHPSLDFVVTNTAQVQGPPVVLEPSLLSVDVPEAAVAESTAVAEAAPSSEPSPPVAVTTAAVSPSPPGPLKNIPDDLTKLADISLAESPKKKKISKEDFLRPGNKIENKDQDSADPLDQLDPLWSLK